MKNVNLQKTCDTVKEIAVRNNLDFSLSDNIAVEMMAFSVIVPVVGHFSVGKSYTINKALDISLLPTSTSAETAIPAEICAGNNVLYAYKGEREEKYAVGEFDIRTAAANGYDRLKLMLDNEKLRQANNVTIVDMPGLDSSYNEHSEAAFNYLTKSVAYIIFLDAEKPVLTDSMVGQLKKLDTYGKPTYFVMNKCDKIDNINEIKEYYRREIPKYLKTKDIRIFKTGKRGKYFADGADALYEIIKRLHNDSETLFTDIFSEKIKNAAKEYVSHLSVKIQALDSKAEEIADTIEALKEKSIKTKDSLKVVGKDIFSEADRIADRIAAQIRSEIMNAESELFDLAVHQKENALKTRVEGIVDRCISNGMSELEQAIKRYFTKVSDTIDKNFSFDNVKFDSSQAAEMANAIKGLLTTLSSAIGGTIGSILGGAAGSLAIPTLAATFAATAGGAGLGATLGTVGSIAGPLGTAIGAGIGLLISKGIQKRSREKQLSEARESFHQNLAGYCDKIAANLKSSIRDKVSEIEEKVNAETDRQFENIQNELKKALDEKERSAEENAREKESILNDIKLLEGVINGI